MPTYNTVAEYTQAINAEINTVTDAATRRHITDFLSYAAAKEEEEADNKDRRPRPDGSENAAYYRQLIDDNNLPSGALCNLIQELIDLVSSLENGMQP